MLKNFGMALILTMMTAGCQTSMLKQFSTIKPGMEKDDVLDLMGSPTRSQRFHGKDRWTYVFYDDRIRFEKEVHFFEGNAVYVGDIWQPPTESSAYQVDKVNEEKNKQVDKMMANDLSNSREAFEKFEKASRGEDKVRYIPDFEPIR